MIEIGEKVYGPNWEGKVVGYATYSIDDYPGEIRMGYCILMKEGTINAHIRVIHHSYVFSEEES